MANPILPLSQDFFDALNHDIEKLKALKKQMELQYNTTAMTKEHPKAGVKVWPKPMELIKQLYNMKDSVPPEGKAVIMATIYYFDFLTSQFDVKLHQIKKRPKLVPFH